MREVKIMDDATLAKELAFAHDSTDDGPATLEWYAALLNERARRMREAEREKFDPVVNIIPKGDHNSMFPRVEVILGDRQVNVGEGFVEWGSTSLHGMDGADIELLPDGGAQLRFQESSRLFVCDRRGIRLYDSDSQDEDMLIIALDHEDYFAGKPPVLGPGAGSRT